MEMGGLTKGPWREIWLDMDSRDLQTKINPFSLNSFGFILFPNSINIIIFKLSSSEGMEDDIQYKTSHTYYSFPFFFFLLN